MDKLNRTLMAKPDGVLSLFLEAGVSVEFLACAFETDAQMVECSLREAMRKRESIRAEGPLSVELIRKTQGA